MLLFLPDVQSTRHLLRTVQAAVTPTKVLPAPQGSTMTPDLARPLPNIFLKLFSYTQEIKGVAHKK